MQLLGAEKRAWAEIEDVLLAAKGHCHKWKNAAIPCVSFEKTEERRRNTFWSRHDMESASTENSSETVEAQVWPLRRRKASTSVALSELNCSFGLQRFLEASWQEAAVARGLEGASRGFQQNSLRFS